MSWRVKVDHQELLALRGKAAAYEQLSACLTVAASRRDPRVLADAASLLRERYDNRAEPDQIRAACALALDALGEGMSELNQALWEMARRPAAASN
jgi:hypothetical protein